MRSVELRKMKALGDEMAPLVIEAESEGHRSMRRLRDEWSSGANRFQGAGEFLLAAYAGGKLIAVGGLNIDPYSSALGIGRIRHVYVCSQARRRGVGTMLVKHIIVGAGRRFSTLRLRTTTAEAAAFYERLGFHGCNEEAATHILELGAT